jgi:hypothetical protein
MVEKLVWRWDGELLLGLAPQSDISSATRVPISCRIGGGPVPHNASQFVLAHQFLLFAIYIRGVTNEHSI